MHSTPIRTMGAPSFGAGCYSLRGPEAPIVLKAIAPIVLVIQSFQLQILF